MITGAAVIIDSVDQSANLTGMVEIDIEESMARTATFDLLIDSGVGDLVGWVGKSVEIKSNIDSNIQTEFTGVIDSPVYELETGITRFSCTDNMQEIFETKTLSEIDALIPGSYWSVAVFNESQGWEYAQERMSTIPSAMDMNELNVVRITSWAAKGTADKTITDADHVYQSLINDAIANRRNIINAANITLDYGYTRLKERQLDYNLNDGLADSNYVCGQFSNPYLVPSKSRIDDSISSAGWELVGNITYQDLPSDGTYQPCDVLYSHNPLLARGASFTVGKRYAQNVTEKYTIRIESADSIDAMGEIAINQSAALRTDYDLTTWNESKISDGWGDFGTPATDINNDEYVNKSSDSDRQSAIDTAINLATTKILSAHRNTLASYACPYDQTIDLTDTILINSSKLTAKGKVSKIVKTIDTFSGKSLCNITIRLSKPFGVGVPSADNPPEVPDGLPTVEDSQTVDLIPYYHLGGQDPTVYDPDWAGWITDYITITEPGHVAYPTEFVVNTPAITLNSIDNVEPDDSSLVNVTIPDDTLL